MKPFCLSQFFLNDIGSRTRIDLICRCLHLSLIAKQTRRAHSCVLHFRSPAGQVQGLQVPGNVDRLCYFYILKKKARGSIAQMWFQGWKDSVPQYDCKDRPVSDVVFELRHCLIFPCNDTRATIKNHFSNWHYDSPEQWPQSSSVFSFSLCPNNDRPGCSIFSVLFHSIMGHGQPQWPGDSRGIAIN